MDLYTLLLIIFFVVIPLIQHFMERQKGEVPPPDESDEQIEPVRRAPSRTGGDGWSGEWGEWPTQQEEEKVEWEPWQVEPRRAPAPEPAADSLEAPAPPAPAPAPEPTLGWEQVRIEVKREERPVHVRAEVPPVVSLENVAADWTSTPRRIPAALGLAPGHRRRGTRAERLIRSRKELRAAVVLAEVLGPPRALRSAEERL